MSELFSIKTTVTVITLGILLSCVYTCVYTFKMYCKNRYVSSSDKVKIERLLRQTARWATAADQDTNPYITNLHATYAMGYLMALREIYPDHIIQSVSDINVNELDTQINKVMDSAIKSLVVTCPEGQPKNVFLASIAKEGGIYY
jgi:hypothetical protein